MNKLSVGLLLAASLFLIDVSPAAAHTGVDGIRAHSYGHQLRTIRHEMPRWLRHDPGFRHWYRHSPLKRYRQIGWNQLYEIYRWERRYFSGRYYDRNDEHRRRDSHRRPRRHYD